MWQKEQRSVSSPLVSVVMPVYNGVRYLDTAVASVLNQTYQPIELILVDDGSTDGSWNLIAAYGSRVRAVRQSNGGVGRARSTGIENARGDFIAFLDQDDWWMPEKVARQVQLFLQDECVGLVHTGVGHFDDVASAFVGPLAPDARPEDLVGRCYDLLLLGNAIYNSSVMVRRSVLDVIGGIDLEIVGNTVQDYDLWLRIARQSAFAYVPDELSVFRLHGAQGTWDRRKMLSEELRLLGRHTKGAERSGPVSARIGATWQQLGIAQLDASDRRAARECFANSIRVHWSWKSALLLILSALPAPALDGVRNLRSRWRLRSPSRTGVGAPEWTK